MKKDFWSLLMDKQTANLIAQLGWKLVLHNPHYGVNGRPYTLVATKDSTVIREGFWSKGEALDRRDCLLEEGWPSVIVLGLPTVLSAHMCVSAETSSPPGPTCAKCGSQTVSVSPHGPWPDQWECSKCGEIFVPPA